MPIGPVKIPQKRLAEIWAQVPPDYYDRGVAQNPLQKLWHTRKLRHVINLLPPQTKKILDVGCSSALLTAEVAKQLPKSKVFGVDSYKKAIDFAKTKYPHLKLIVADAHRLPFKDKTFDLVICTETLEHVTDPKKSLLEIGRVLKKGGRGIISMDSGSLLFRTVWFFWTKTKGKVWEDAHLHEFNARALEDLIKEAGFKINKKIYSHLGMAVTFLVSPKK
jgi:ubiquinone/menaquinone biosynthesis C-methylase UbiE